VGDDSLENLEKLWLGHLSVVVLVNCGDKLVHFLLGNLSALAHVFKGVVDELGDFVGLQGAALVLIVGVKDCIDCVSEVII